jgi:hypothetical protein
MNTTNTTQLSPTEMDREYSRLRGGLEEQARLFNGGPGHNLDSTKHRLFITDGNGDVQNPHREHAEAGNLLTSIGAKSHSYALLQAGDAFSGIKTTDLHLDNYKNAKTDSERKDILKAAQNSLNWATREIKEYNKDLPDVQKRELTAMEPQDTENTFLRGKLQTWVNDFNASSATKIVTDGNGNVTEQSAQAMRDARSSLTDGQKTTLTAILSADEQLDTGDAQRKKWLNAVNTGDLVQAVQLRSTLPEKRAFTKNLITHNAPE